MAEQHYPEKIDVCKDGVCIPSSSTVCTEQVWKNDICVLKKFGFGDNFINWIKILWNDQPSIAT